VIGNIKALVYDLGGTYLRCGSVESEGPVRKVVKEEISNFLDYDPNVVWNDVLSRILTYERNVRQALSPEAPVVLAFPGPIRGHRDILHAPTVLGDSRYFPDICAELERQMKRRVHLLNDVSAAAFHLSRQTTAARLMVVTISSGIGSKIFDRKHPSGIIDEPPYAGEIGHIVVDEGTDAPRCDCGGLGHLAAISSGRGVERLARRLAGQDALAFSRSQCVRLFGAKADELSNYNHIVPALRGEDEWALSLLKITLRPLAKVLISVVIGAGVEQVFIIGGFALSVGNTYLNSLRAAVADASDYHITSELLPRMFRLGRANEETCLEGAGLYARQLLSK
jgi:glucokinase